MTQADPSLPDSPLPSADAVLAWYDRHGRRLPWRETREPYRVWLSEIMAQQTTIATVLGYYGDFVTRWPTVADLARAELDAVLHAWQGLGYYARARNLHRCAQMVAGELGGRFPDTEAALRRLPGIGAYSAAAIAAICFGAAATPVDGNVIRVVSRLFALAERKAVDAHAARLTPADRPGDYCQAVMDLGAMVCTPRRPKCLACPWRDACRARRAGAAEAYPPKAATPARPIRHGVVFWLQRGDGAVLLRRRPPSGLLGGMMEFPSTDWRETPWTESEAVAAAPVRAEWRHLPGTVRHTFSHFHLELSVWTATVKGAPHGVWCAGDRLGEHALPTVMKKIARHVANRART